MSRGAALKEIQSDHHVAAELKVGEVAARCGVAISTIRFYEAKGLIKSLRTQGNQRRYPREVLRRKLLIRPFAS